jgi:hypothetical protein
MSVEMRPDHQLARDWDRGPTRSTFIMWRVGLWSGVTYSVLGLFFWAILARFLPPPHQSWDADRVKEFFSDQPRVLIGIVGYCFIAPLWTLMSIALARIMSRIEGRDGILHQIEFFGGIGTTFVTLFSGVAWMVAAYQPQTRSAESIKLFSDFGWLIFNMTVMLTFVQYASFGICVFLDHRDEPLLPRWLGYLSFMVAASFLPICLMPFFPNSPFAWNGLWTYWIGLGLFFAWVPFALTAAFKAVGRIEREELVGKAA